MDKFVMVVFANEGEALKGAHALKNLHMRKRLRVYGAAIIAKDQKGKLSIRKLGGEATFRARFGALIGGFIGLLGGPLGAAIGFGVGLLVGGWRDIANLGVGKDFLDRASDELASGKAAILAEIAERQLGPLDARMRTVGGVVFRQGGILFQKRAAPGQRARRGNRSREVRTQTTRPERLSSP
jgi:uncharacterized membrane protein